MMMSSRKSPLSPKKSQLQINSAGSPSSVVVSSAATIPIPKEPKYTWKALGHGSYNKVWKSNFESDSSIVEGDSYKGPWVLKYPLSSNNPISDAMNDKHRAVRLWNEINHLLPKAGLHKQGWVAPYIQNTRPATDDEIAQKSIEIYTETRRITIDAAIKGNFLTSIDTGKVVLVDMDLALKRRSSKASIDFSQNLEERFASYWEDSSLQKSMPKTIEVTRNLLFFEDSLEMESIDQLNKNKLITVKNIQALTWLRKNKKTLTVGLFTEIDLLTSCDIDVTDDLVEALYLAEKPKVKPFLFFSSKEKECDNSLLSKKVECKSK